MPYIDADGRKRDGSPDPMSRRVHPSECSYCEYDRRFPPLQNGGWLQMDNNGPIVSCPVCNPRGDHARE